MTHNTVGYLVSSIFLEQWGKLKGFKKKKTIRLDLHLLNLGCI